jgi:hypothetical protein
LDKISTAALPLESKRRKQHCLDLILVKRLQDRFVRSNRVGLDVRIQTIVKGERDAGRLCGDAQGGSEQRNGGP